MSREAAEVARKAAEIIQERGKATGTIKDDQGRVCLFGALARANIGHSNLSRIAINHEINWKLRNRFGHDNTYYRHIVAFNDDPATTERDVAKLLLAVADELEVAP